MNYHPLVIAFLIFAQTISGLFNVTSSKNLASAKSDLEINIFLPEAVTNAATLSQFGSQLGVKFDSAKWYLDWQDNFTPEIARGFQSQGAIPELVLQPQINGACISYNDVLNGQHNTYLDQFSRSIKNLGFPIRITLAPEMNSDWSPWGMGNCGNNTDNFKAFWRYTVSRFRSNGADVQWIYAPNIHYYGEKASYAALYPGDDYVDYLGLEGYNWGTTRDWSSWQSFKEVFGPSYNDLRNVSGKSIIITEFASAEQGGSKAQWILDMFYDLKTSFGAVKGITWFNIDKETDWRINSSSSSMQGFIKGVKSYYSSASKADYVSEENEAAAAGAGEENTDDTKSSQTNSGLASDQATIEAETIDPKKVTGNIGNNAEVKGATIDNQNINFIRSLLTLPIIYFQFSIILVCFTLILVLLFYLITRMIFDYDIGKRKTKKYIDGLFKDRLIDNKNIFKPEMFYGANILTISVE